MGPLDMKEIITILPQSFMCVCILADVCAPYSCAVIDD